MLVIKILRLDHRKKRDKRVTTHCALTARAFGASEIIISGERDDEILKTIEKVVEKWGGRFKICYEKNWRAVIKKFKKLGGKIVHLTFYGIPLQKVIFSLRQEKKILIIVGAGKVPREIYTLADWNVSITNQPHSEVAALAVFLHEYFQGRELEKKFFGAKIKIIPSAHKKIIKLLNKAVMKNRAKYKNKCS